MPDVDDIALLREYANDGSESAFAEIVRRHINLVYSVALRFTNNSGDAQDVTQAVFVILATKASRLRPKTILTGWLYETTRFTAMNFLTCKTRREAREQEAYMQSTLNDGETENVWPQLAPLLESAMARLNEKDRTLVALRFFENRSIAETAASLGINEWTARKRVERVMEKLRIYFSKRGVSSTATTIAGAISANSIQAAPAALIKITTAVALAKGATASISVLTLVKGTMKMMTWLKIKFAVGVSVSLLLATGVATVAISQTHDVNKLPRQDAKITAANSPVAATGTNISVVSDQALTNALQTLSEQLKKPISARDQQLQKSFSQFPLLTPAIDTNGQPAFQILALENSVEFAGKKYYGFRFTVPSRKSHEDFVMAFVQPEMIASWYVLPQSGNMEGFQDYFYRPKNVFPSADALLPLNGRRLILQSLSGNNLENNKTYLIWFTFNQKSPARMSVAFTFTNLKNDKLSDMEDVMALNGHHYYIDEPLSLPIVNPTNHHIYILLRPATWEESEAEAVNLGGHLATIRNQAEEDWIFKTFGHYKGMQRLLWIGLSDRDKKFHFSWTSGESVSYMNWAKYQPYSSKLDGENYVAIYYPNHSEKNKWNDWNDRTVDPIGLPMDGVVEIIPKENAPALPNQLVANTIATQINPDVVITNDSGSIKLQWPISASNYMLEATTNLSEPFMMFGYSEMTNFDTGIIYVTITNPEPQMFFRLQKP